MNDRKFTITLSFEETLEKNDNYPTFILWKKLEVCSTLEDVKETLEDFTFEMKEYIDNKMKGIEKNERL